jgi:hypothetical protein
MYKIKKVKGRRYEGNFCDAEVTVTRSDGALWRVYVWDICPDNPNWETVYGCGVSMEGGELDVDYISQKFADRGSYPDAVEIAGVGAALLWAVTEYEVPRSAPFQPNTA